MLKAMCRSLRDMVLGAALFGAAVAVAAVGIAPITGGGPALIDQTWLNGLAGGQNFSYQSGITAHAGGTQAACLVLPAGIYLLEVDTVASSADSVCLPFAVQGMNISIANAGANSMNIFAQAATNGASGSTDTINGASNTSAYSLSANNNAECFAAKNGGWKCVKGS